jgi:hypothetical protein
MAVLVRLFRALVGRMVSIVMELESEIHARVAALIIGLAMEMAQGMFSGTPRQLSEFTVHHSKWGLICSGGFF